MKYQKMLNMLKNSKDVKKNEKVLAYEDKRTLEINELLEEFSQKKKDGLT